MSERKLELPSGASTGIWCRRYMWIAKAIDAEKSFGHFICAGPHEHSQVNWREESLRPPSGCRVAEQRRRPKESWRGSVTALPALEKSLPRCRSQTKSVPSPNGQRRPILISPSASANRSCQSLRKRCRWQRRRPTRPPRVRSRRLARCCRGARAVPGTRLRVRSWRTGAPKPVPTLTSRLGRRR